MAGSGGKLEKMLIMAFADASKAETGGPSNADLTFTALINPESYTLDYKVEFSGEDKNAQASGTSGQQLKFEKVVPPDLSFEFLFDATGIIEMSQKAGKNTNDAKKESITEDINAFRELLIGYNGDAHETRHLKLVWGDGLVFVGRATEMSIAYKLFNASGKPVRAAVRVKFKSSIEEGKRIALENKKSPDLTHYRRVKAGDTLHLMCQRIYGDARYYLQVAEMNQLGNFRRLTPGQELLFPPIDKTAN